jgi:hypothetical protein
VAAVFGNLRADPLARSVAAAEDLAVLARRRPQHVVADADAGLPALRRVVEPAAVGQQRDAAVEPAGQHVGPVGPRRDVAHAQLRLVFAASAEAVDEDPPVLRDVRDADVDGVVGAERVRVQEHLVAALPPLADVEDREIVGRAPLLQEVAAAAPLRCRLHVVAAEGGQPRADRFPARPAVQPRVRVPVLRLDPGPGLGAAAVLEPAVGVDDGDPVQDLSHVVPPSRRRRGLSRLGDGDRRRRGHE